MKVYSYSNYRDFLRDRFLQLKEIEPKLTHRELCKRAGFKSSNSILLLINGKRNLTKDSAGKLGNALGLINLERNFFVHLVLFNQAKHLEDKLELARKMFPEKMIQREDNLNEEIIEFYKHWYNIVIFEMIKLSDLDPRADRIAKKIGSSVSTADVQGALDNLLSLKLIQYDANGKLQVTNRTLSTPSEIHLPLIANFHREMLKQAVGSIESVQPEKRDISGLTIAISTSAIPELKNLIRDFRDKVNQLAEEMNSPDEVYQLAIQFFPVTKSDD